MVDGKRIEARTAAISVRVRPAVKSALEQVAKADDRTMAQYVERLIIGHLRERGVLGDVDEGD
jgi:hypothetical protein